MKWKKYCDTFAVSLTCWKWSISATAALNLRASLYGIFSRTSISHGKCLTNGMHSKVIWIISLQFEPKSGISRSPNGCPYA